MKRRIREKVGFEADVERNDSKEEVKEEREMKMEDRSSIVHSTPSPQFKYKVSRISTIKWIVKVNKQLAKTKKHKNQPIFQQQALWLGVYFTLNHLVSGGNKSQLALLHE